MRPNIDFLVLKRFGIHLFKFYIWSFPKLPRICAYGFLISRFQTFPCKLNYRRLLHSTILQKIIPIGNRRRKSGTKTRMLYTILKYKRQKDKKNEITTNATEYMRWRFNRRLNILGLLGYWTYPL